MSRVPANRSYSMRSWICLPTPFEELTGIEPLLESKERVRHPPDTAAKVEHVEAIVLSPERDLEEQQHVGTETPTLLGGFAQVIVKPWLSVQHERSCHDGSRLRRVLPQGEAGDLALPGDSASTSLGNRSSWMRPRDASFLCRAPETSRFLPRPHEPARYSARIFDDPDRTSMMGMHLSEEVSSLRDAPPDGAGESFHFHRRVGIVVIAEARMEADEGRDNATLLAPSIVRIVETAQDGASPNAIGPP